MDIKITSNIDLNVVKEELILFHCLEQHFKQVYIDKVIHNFSISYRDIEIIIFSSGDYLLFTVDNVILETITIDAKNVEERHITELSQIALDICEEIANS